MPKEVLTRCGYSKCIKPYENKKRIDEIRKNNSNISSLGNMCSPLVLIIKSLYLFVDNIA